MLFFVYSAWVQPSRLFDSLWKRKNSLFLCLALAPVFAFVYWLAYWLRFEGHLDQTTWSNILRSVGWVILVKAVVFGWLCIYQGWHHYLTFHDLVAICQASIISLFVLALAHTLVRPDFVVPRSVFLLDLGATIVTVGGLRSLSRLVEEGRHAFRMSDGDTRALIAGTNSSGEALLRNIRRNPQLKYRIVGFLSEESPVGRSRIGGVPILGGLADATNIIGDSNIQEVLLSNECLCGKKVRNLVEVGNQHGVKVKILPSYEQLLDGNVDLKPRTVSIEHLLHREPVQLNLRELHQWLDDRVLLITGSAGSIGSEICRQLLQFSPRQLVLVDRSENGQFFLEREMRTLAPEWDIRFRIADVGDETRMETVFQEFQPDIVFHAAAYKHVPLMEANPGEAIKNTVLATRKIVDLSVRHRVRSFVMISTDKAVNPTSVMGACKRVAELYVQALADVSDCRVVTVRFGNVLDSAGSVVPIFREQITNGGPITVTHPDMTRYFMTIPEASQLVIQAGAMGKGGEIFVLDMGAPVKIVDLAEDMIRLSGLRVGEDVEVQFVGIRPGEKLFEELHIDGEKYVGTSHPKILVANCDERDVQQMRYAIGRLASLTEAPRELIINELRATVTQYRPKSRLLSVYTGDTYPKAA